MREQQPIPLPHIPITPLDVLRKRRENKTWKESGSGCILSSIHGKLNMIRCLQGCIVYGQGFPILPEEVQKKRFPGRIQKIQIIRIGKPRGEANMLDFVPCVEYDSQRWR